METIANNPSVALLALIALAWIARELWGAYRRRGEQDEENVAKKLDSITAKLDAIGTSLARHDTARELHDQRLDRLESELQRVRERDHDLMSQSTVAVLNCGRAVEAALRYAERRASGLHPAVLDTPQGD